MKQKIAIIGAGLLGVTVYLKLKKNGFDCTLFDKKKSILQGASTNNLNRVHFGYHYPRDEETANQSLKGYKSFKKFYPSSIIKKFDNYYFIAKKSRVSFLEYLNFCKKNNLKFKEINLKKFYLKNQNLQGGIKVEEPIYDWKIIKQDLDKRIKKLKNNKIKLEESVLEITYKKNYNLVTEKKNYLFDIIVDASYEGSNKISKKIITSKKFVYQLVIVLEFTSKYFTKMGLALMDGKFFSFLPKGKSNKHILYHVKHSVLKNKISYEYPEKWIEAKITNKKITVIKDKIISSIKKYFPNLGIKFYKKIFLSARVLPINVDKTDKRVSKVIQIKKGYFKILSAKIDHSVDIADKIAKYLK